ncbi:carbon storage regulator CsrA [Desulfovulcanus sp.]
MLILSRRQGESIHIGDDIKVTILSIKGKQVKIGIEVPEHICVYRDEVYKKIQEENLQAILTKEDDFLAVAGLWQRKK